MLHTFGGVGDGQYPDIGQLVAVGSVLFGETIFGGSSGPGTIYSINTDGSGYTILHNFSGPDGGAPIGFVISGSTIYGATQGGGTNQRGTLFRMNTDGTGFQTIYQFPSYNGQNLVSPFGELAIVGTTLYGESSGGGSNGALYSVNTDGTNFTEVHPFFGGRNDGEELNGGLVSSGTTVYGTTILGGAGGSGTVFRINANGSGFQLIESLPLTDPHNPEAAVTIGGTILYSTTSEGGPGNGGSVFRVNADGTGYQLLHVFPANAGDGSDLNMPVTLAGSTLFGTTEHSGDGGTGWGTLFEMNTDGSGYQDLYDGAALSTPGPVTVVGSTIFGVTNGGGNGYGTLYSFSVPEPSTFALLAVGGLMMGGIAERRERGGRIKSVVEGSMIGD